MANTIKAKNVEIYIGQVDTIASFTPGSRGNNFTLAGYVEAGIAGSSPFSSAVLSEVLKYSDISTEISIEPAEDDVEITKYFGSDGDAQNTATETITNNDMDITLTADSKFEDELIKFGLSESGITNSTYTNYQSFNYGVLTTLDKFVLLRTKRLIGSTYYFQNILIVNPVFKNVGTLSGSAEDAVNQTEYAILGNKSYAWIDFYSGASDETLTNIDAL